MLRSCSSRSYIRKVADLRNHKNHRFHYENGGFSNFLPHFLSPKKRLGEDLKITVFNTQKNRTFSMEMNVDISGMGIKPNYVKIYIFPVWGEHIYEKYIN